MEYIRRRAFRLYFGGAAEIADTNSKRRLLALTTDLSAFGCFVKTETPWPTGTEIAVKITHKGQAFVGLGTVAHARPELGMGIAFSAVTREDQEILDRWLSHSDRRQREVPVQFRTIN
jgi:hypothetical protein